MHTVYKATAPGSCMLLGEYAVLFNEPALVFAIDKTMTVTLTPATHDKVTIRSALGEHECALSKIEIIKPFEFVLSAIQSIKQYPSGFRLDIHADFSDQLGFGSSAAVTVATLACLTEFCNKPLSKAALLKKARALIQDVQGLGSGADVAASVYGGLCLYQMDQETVKQLPFTPDIHLIYSGSKAKTKDIVKQVLQNFEHSDTLQALMQSQGKLVRDATNAIAQQNWQALSSILTNAQDFFKTMGASTKTLETILKSCRHHPDLIGAKISGAGFGDCVIALGDLPKNTFPQNRAEKALGIKQFDIAPAKAGVVCSTQSMT